MMVHLQEKGKINVITGFALYTRYVADRDEVDSLSILSALVYVLDYQSSRQGYSDI